MRLADIEYIMHAIPLLNDFGIGHWDGDKKKTVEQQEVILQEKRQRLKDSIKEITAVYNWLDTQRKIKNFNMHHSSYGLKHIAEKEIGYITNGVFICAAILKGYDYKILSGFPNVYFNMSEKTIKAACKRVGILC